MKTNQQGGFVNDEAMGHIKKLLHRYEETIWEGKPPEQMTAQEYAAFTQEALEYYGN